MTTENISFQKKKNFGMCELIVSTNIRQAIAGDKQYKTPSV